MNKLNPKRFLASLLAVLMLSQVTGVAPGIFAEQPEHAGMCKLFVGTNSKNYNTAIGLGALIVRIRTEGVKLEPNAELYRKTITVSEAKEYAEGTKKAALFEYNGSADGIDQTAVQFWFTGMNTVHAKKDFPTKPGKYIVTASVVGGDYFAPPVTFTFRIVAD